MRQAYNELSFKPHENTQMMKTSEILTLQILKFKKDLLSGHSSGVNPDPAWTVDAVPSGPDVRNICAFISNPLFDETERLCSVLSMSKRRFVELALRDLVQKTNDAISAAGLTGVTSESWGVVPVDQE